MSSELHGKSGCQLEIVNKNFDFFLKKFSKNIESNARLVIQAEKQIEFYKQNEFVFVKTPEITSIYGGSSVDLAFTEMKYIFGKNAVSFLKEADVKTIDTFIENILIYLDSIFKHSAPGNIDSVAKKAEQVNSLNFSNKDEIMKRLRNIPKEDLLIGQCHGDLTMANMVFTNSTIYLLDFLNVYIDSPLLDLLSFRQDTHHLWSCFLTKTYSCRPLEVLKYIDDIIIKKYSWVINSEWYKYLSLMNYVRMHPFNTKKEETEFINNCISEYL